MKIKTLEAKRLCRKKINFTDVSLTDPSHKKSCDINNIVKTYHKTGVLPQGKQGFYGDVSELPTIHEAFEIVQTASKLFYELPADVRKLMDNDPSKMEMWLSDENNRSMAEQYGLLNKKEEIADNAPMTSQQGASNEGKTSVQEDTKSDSQNSGNAV